MPWKTCTGSFEGSDAPPIYLISKEQECVSGKMVLLAGQVNKEGLFSSRRNHILRKVRNQGALATKPGYCMKVHLDGAVEKTVEKWNGPYKVFYIRLG